MSRIAFTCLLLAVAGGAGAQQAPGGYCMYGPEDPATELSVGAKRNEIEIRVPRAVDPTRVVCVAKMACTIKAKPVQIVWEIRKGGARTGPSAIWSDVLRANIEYADGSKERCDVQSIGFGPPEFPKVDPKLLDLTIPK